MKLYAALTLDLIEKVETSTRPPKLLLGILGAVAEFESNIEGTPAQRNRSHEGGWCLLGPQIHRGRHTDALNAKARARCARQATDVAISRASVYRALKNDLVVVA